MARKLKTEPASSWLCNIYPYSIQLYPVLLQSLRILHLRQFRCLVCCDQTVNNLLNVAVHDGIQFIQSQFDTVIGHTTLWEVVGTDLL